LLVEIGFQNGRKVLPVFGAMCDNHVQSPALTELNPCGKYSFYLADSKALKFRS